MSEWTSVLAVFWVLWALDGVRWGARRVFTVLTGGWPRRVGTAYSRLSRPGLSPATVRLSGGDIPVSLSPVGICNRPAAAAGRPVETPVRVVAWRWEEIREVGVAGGWIYVNGQRFCADTGHLRAAELLALAQMPAALRPRRIRVLIARWFRPEHLRRRVRVLIGRTRVVAALNGLALALLAMVSVYVVGDVASRLPSATSARLAAALPWIVGGIFVIHLAAVVTAWRALRRLGAVLPEKRGSTLLSPLLLPPQALRLRAVLGEGFFPAQHPVAIFVAAGRGERATFATLADARWPIGDADDPPLAREIATWFRAALEPHVLAVSGAEATTLLAPPTPDTPESCAYCPRCGDQFVAGREVCPNGVRLIPLSGSGGDRR